jgi:hypothetical protein
MKKRNSRGWFPTKKVFTWIEKTDLSIMSIQTSVKMGLCEFAPRKFVPWIEKTDLSIMLIQTSVKMGLCEFAPRKFVPG